MGQIKSLHEHFVHQGMIVTILEKFSCSTLLRCATAIMHGIAESKFKNETEQNKKLKSHGRGRPKLEPEDMEDDDYYQAEYVDPEDKTLTQVDMDHINLDKLMEYKTEERIVIILNNITTMDREVLNDLIYTLICAKKNTGTKYNLIFAMTGSIYTFHQKISISYIPYLRTTTIELPSIRDAILAVIAKYVTDYTFMIQPPSQYLAWMYQVVLMHNVSLNSFKKMFLYMNFRHIYQRPLYFLLKYIESDEERLKLYKFMLKKLTPEMIAEYKQNVQYFSFFFLFF